MSSAGNNSWLAIDFGTCYSSAARMHDGRPEAVKDPIQHSYSTPSSVLMTKQGELVVGYAAERYKASRPFHYQEEFKRVLGRRELLPIGEREFSPEELATRVIEFLKQEAEESDGPYERTVITVPAAYEEHRRELMKAAAREAGFKEVELLEEPVAAVVAAMGGNAATEVNRVLVYDLGGGTFDAALVEFDGGEYSVLGQDGVPDVGGSDFDRAIERDLAERAGDALAAALADLTSNDEKRRTAAKRAELSARDFCRKIKHDLSVMERAEDVLNLAAEPVEYDLSRVRLAELVSEDLSRTVACCRGLVEREKVDPASIDTIILVGGSCRLPFVGERLAHEFERPHRKVRDPELAVCIGAALWAPGEKTSRQPKPKPKAKPKSAPKSEKPAPVAEPTPAPSKVNAEEVLTEHPIWDQIHHDTRGILLSKVRDDEEIRFVMTAARSNRCAIVVSSDRVLKVLTYSGFERLFGTKNEIEEIAMSTIYGASGGMGGGKLKLKIRDAMGDRSVVYKGLSYSSPRDIVDYIQKQISSRKG